MTPAAYTPRVDFEHVWKKFHYGVRHDSLRDFIPAAVRRLTGNRRPVDELGAEDFWALRDVSFSVEPGEALGIIGPNGSGKSTALKLLTQVLGPTRGRCRITGRAGVMIELASGFHPDLTGRENVFLQGAIMGMRRAEIARSFDQIVEFSGVAKFIDTPVKRYSSGMSARLGFAIAAHLDPEVLVIDEVLAVGDAVFQRKAMDRVAELVRRQIPVVIVTHQLEQVGALCTKALVLEYGHVVAQGPPGECVSAYLERSLHRRILGAAAIAAKSVEAYGGTTVRSGDRLTFGVDVVVRDAAHVDEQQLAMRVRAAMTGSVVYEAPLDAAAAFPSRSEWFWLEPSLQFNVPPGPYYVEMCVRSRLDGRELVRGPGVYVDVTPSGVFDGPVQLNLACRVTHAEEYGRERQYSPPGCPTAGR